MMKNTGTETARDFPKKTEVTTGELYIACEVSFVASWILGLHSHRIEMDDFDSFVLPFPYDPCMVYLPTFTTEINQM